MKARLSASLAVLRKEEVIELLDHLWSRGSFQIRRPPETGLVMYKVRDPFDVEFHLGEVLICETEVDLDGFTGWGMISGDEPERAILLASVEAAEVSGNREMLSAVAAFLEKTGERGAQQELLLSRLAASTAVRFESMSRESVDFGSLGE